MAVRGEAPDETVLHELVIVGAGPVGLVMAAVWGQLGREGLLVERQLRQYGLPRAGHIDHEIMRLLQSLDAEGPTVDDACAPDYYKWINAEGETLLEFPWGEEAVSGWYSDYMQNSALLEASLLARVEADPRLAHCPGWQAVGVAQTEDHVELTVERVGSDVSNGGAGVETRTLRARYLFACDGANSRTRSMLGVGRLDLGFNENWLVVDARRKHGFELPFDSGQICDPRRPTTVLPLGKSHRRWEFHLRPDEDPSDFEKPEAGWRLLAGAGVGPDDVEPVRQLVYTFEARLAEQWRVGRIFLGGDAAHTMPPFMGQGMCSGMRDAKNLAWKLDLVLAGIAAPGLLETYQKERYPHVYDWTMISLESGRIPCIVDPEQARVRDQMFRDGYRPPIPDFPQLASGILDCDFDGTPVAPAGELSVQGRVSLGGRTDLLDRLVPGRRFMVVSIADDPRIHLGDEQIRRLESIGATFVCFGAGNNDAASGTINAVDVDGAYSRWFDERRATVAIFRPDFYVFGASAASGVGPMVDELLALLASTDAPASAEGASVR